MDKGTISGLLLGIGLLTCAVTYGGELTPFVDIPALLITFGGTIASVFIAFPLSRILGVFSVIAKCFVTRLPEIPSVISQFRHYAVRARRDGLVVLEREADGLTDPFLQRGLEKVAAGTSADQLTADLQLEIYCIEQRHTSGRRIFEAMGAAAPAFGMIGTIIGLVQMLRTLDDPSQIGSGMAVALLTTLYGAVLANLICLPLAAKLETRSQEEVMVREVMLCGLIALVEGHAPRVVEDKLAAFLSPRMRESVTMHAGGPQTTVMSEVPSRTAAAASASEVSHEQNGDDHESGAAESLSISQGGKTGRDRPASTRAA